MFVLDVLRYDVEQVVNILALLNSDGCIGWRAFWARDFTEQDVVPVLRELASNGLVEVLSETDQAELRPAVGTIELGGDTKLWFAITDKGRRAWEAWEDPPVLPEDR
jgi:hypothetical protein